MIIFKSDGLVIFYLGIKYCFCGILGIVIKDQTDNVDHQPWSNYNKLVFTYPSTVVLLLALARHGFMRSF